MYAQPMHRKKQQIQRVGHQVKALVKPQVRRVSELVRSTSTKLSSQRIHVVRAWSRKDRRSDYWRRYIFRGVDVLRRENANPPAPPQESDQIDLKS